MGVLARNVSFCDILSVMLEQRAILPQTTSVLPDAADHVVVSVSPKAGAAAARPKIDRLAALLHQAGLIAEVLADLDQVALQANAWHAQGRLRALVGVGGDGTAAELVNRTVPGLPITMLPAGNENLLARHFHLGPSPEHCAATVAAGGLFGSMPAAPRAGSFCSWRVADWMARSFAACMAAGRDRSAARVMSNQSSIRCVITDIPNFGYIGTTIGLGLPATQSPQVFARWLLAMNLPCYGLDLRIAPEADGSDGLLDVCTFRRGNLWHDLYYLGAMFLGIHQKLADCTIRRVRRLRVTSEEEVPYQLDGDPGGVLPVEIEALPGRLTLVVPADEG